MHRPIDSRRWRQIREIKLSRDPLCERCGAVAVIVHHKDRNENNNYSDNLESLCNHCHEIEHGRKLGVGATMDGLPTNPKHPWNRGGG